MDQDDVNIFDNIDQLMGTLGFLGRFQFAALFGLLMIYSCVSFIMMQMVYAGMTTDWYCIINFSEEAWKNVSFLEEVRDGGNFDINTTSSTIFGARLENQSFRKCYVNGTKCEAFKFTGSSKTIASEWSLVCDMAWVKQIIISVQMAGLFLGTITSGQFGDYFGRKKILYSSLLMSSLIEIVTGFSVSWKMFTACKFFVGICIGIITINAFPYLIELSTPSWRPFLAGFPAFAIGTSIFAVAAYILDDWSSLHFVSGALVLPFLFGWFYFPESPRWLAVHNKLQEAEKAFQIIVRHNRKPVPAGTAALVVKIANEEKECRQSGRIYTMLDLFSTLQVAKITLTASYVFMCINAVFYGVVYGISNLAGNFFLNVFLMSTLQIPVQLTLTYTVKRFGRRQSCVFYFLLSASGAAGCLIISLAVRDVSYKGAIISGLCIMSRVGLGAAFNVVSLLCIELYPTVMRNLGYSFACCFSRVGGITAPFIINLDTKADTSYFIITLIMVSCAALLLIVRETANVPLPESNKRKTRPAPTNSPTLLEDGDRDSPKQNFNVSLPVIF